MFIHEMTDRECRSALENANVGRLGCALDKKPYVVPMNARRHRIFRILPSG
jgi:nitroimidazol reductase NimA-like FMN-containing flavoprotein (pyridoxamine 5'-phosphate oxidase superfamily)